MNALALPDALEAVHQPGTSDLSATGVADLFRISQRSRRNIVTRYTIRIHPSSTKLQAALRDLMRVLFAASVVQPTRSAHCYRECSNPGVSLQDATRYRRQDKGCDRLPGIPSVRDISGDPRTPSRGRVALSGAYARMGELAKEQGGRGAQGRPVQSRGRRSSIPGVGRGPPSGSTSRPRRFCRPAPFARIPRH